MSKNAWGLVAVVVIVVLVIIGFSLKHKSNKPTISTTTTTTSQVASVNNSVLITKTNSSLGKYLADPSGKTLYTYGGDTLNTSNCTGTCIASWPAYEDSGSTSNLPANVGVIKRSDDGKYQYTFNGKPLYFFVDDNQAGAVTGNGVSDFSVAKP